MKLTAKQIANIKSFWLNANDEDKFIIINDMNNWNGCFEDVVWFSMDDFDELCYGMKPWDIARAIYFSDFNPMDNYFKWNVYGNLESADYITCDVEVDGIISNLENIPKEYVDSLEEILDK